jgi:alpha-glucosidase
MTPSPEVVAGSQPWWREAVFYQIYPLSFMDSDGDGFGDLKGITSKLDYLSDTLGVDAIWLSPFYRSPMRDWGYDVSDHTDVDPLFGDIDDARQFLAAAHERGIKVIIDYVLNHSSDEHPWFVESRSSIDNPKRDWYVWRDGKPDGGPPTNWVSVFSGPSWSFDGATDQWHRNTYLPEQPDLNWRNPELVDAMLDVARFWMDMGFDGFRVDAAHQMMKDPQERDNPPVPANFEEPFKDMGEYDKFEHLYDLGHTDVHEVHSRFQAVLDEYDGDRMSIGEVHIFDIGEWAAYYGSNLDELTMPFNFHLMACDWDAASIRILIESVFRNVPDGAWTNWTLGNHDEIRLASRLPEGQERLAAMLLLTLRGSPFLYYGDELGMKQTAVSPQEGRDPWGANVDYLSRDGERTPMQWNRAANAGFAPPTAEPWLPVAADYETVNVESALTDSESTLNMYRRLLALRRGSAALTRGSFAICSSSSDHVLVYRRDDGDESVTVALNFTDQVRSITLPSGSVVFSTIGRDRDDRNLGTVELAPGEGVIVGHPH